jgi:hypothetical protein
MLGFGVIHCSTTAIVKEGPFFWRRGDVENTVHYVRCTAGGSGDAHRPRRIGLRTCDALLSPWETFRL